MVKNYPEITIPEISKEINRGLKVTKEYIKKLKSDGQLRRYGSAKGGHWVVNSNGGFGEVTL
ncbi:MAG: hypothetical protein HY738_04965 [Bacteroidia bacterium]|nr:hypothetical protein [Bacteroidia bacterium]